MYETTTPFHQQSNDIACVCIFFTLLTDRVSTIPSKERGCQSNTGCAGQENQTDIYKIPTTGSKNKNMTKTTKIKKINTRY